ncbi:glycoside hydrolase family 55 protein [Sphingomonas sp. BT-65]|uniref:glycoside hydrolase family 55 protein n=1 Tax=Sphingomonas sp. BT-65 TaxID=2989821 RepID=UPI0022364123|nr:glycoside hydrolase family 55 protein [Sphingomonas sp. BT-65]MCW4463538.1 glycoside hydrolase family 55 protein [Sphingomonas sp. BT-65]
MSTNNTYFTLADLKASPVTEGTTFLVQDTTIADGVFFWSLGDFTGQADDVNVVKADSEPLSNGAWVRQDGKSVKAQHAGLPASIIRSLGDKVWDGITVKDFGAIGDGSNDDTTACQNAIETVTFASGAPSDLNQTGLELVFPRGIYSVDNLKVVNAASANNGGMNGLRLKGHFAVLKGRPDATSILSIESAVDGQNVSGVRVDGFQFDLTAMTTPGYGTRALYLKDAYRIVLRDMQFYGGPADNTHIQFSGSGSQIVVEDVHCARIRIEGDDYGPGQIVWTTMNFRGASWVDLLVDKAWGLNFWGCVAQNPDIAAFSLSNCDNINIYGGDFEGNGGVYIDAMGGNVSRVTSSGNRTSSLSTYILGSASSSRFLDRYPTDRSTTISTNPSEIYNFNGDPLISNICYTYALLTIFGDNGSFGFVDQVAVAFGGVVTVLSSVTAYGSPPARNYTFSGTSFRTQIASGSAQARVIPDTRPIQ